MNLKPRILGRIDTGSSLNNAHRAIVVLHNRQGGILHNDIVELRFYHRTDAFDSAHKPGDQIDAMYTLVHQRAAAIVFPGGAPACAFIIFPRAIVFQIGVRNQDLAEHTALQRFLYLHRNRLKPALEHTAHFHAGFFYGFNQPVHFFIGDLHGLFAQDMLTCQSRLLCHFTVHSAGGTDTYGIDIRIPQHLVIVHIHLQRAILFLELLCLVLDDIAHGHKLCALCFPNCFRVARCNHTASDNTKSYHFIDLLNNLAELYSAFLL